ncbi:hypothetical protein COE18_06680 [Bacillus cereus]|nr:hypothetical protein COE18_06680 [Bacillus cereus]
MADINSYLKNIKTATYGQEVRGSLAEGLEVVNKETEASSMLSGNTKIKQVALEKKYNDQIANMTNENPSASEVIDQRTSGFNAISYETAGKRVDTIDKQLADIAVNIETFGAVGNTNGADDSEAFRKAVEFIKLKKGGTILFPSGRFLITGDFELNEQITLKGNGIANTILVGNFNLKGDYFLKNIYIGNSKHGKETCVIDYNSEDQTPHDPLNSLIGQGAATVVTHYIMSQSRGTHRHYALAVEMDANGSKTTGLGEDGHKVAMYAAARTGSQGAADVWALNTLTEVTQGLAATVNAQGYELDMNNMQGDLYRTWDWTRGNVVGLNITSGGRYPITAGLRIGGTKEENKPSYSMVFEGAQDSLGLILGKYQAGLDFRQAVIASNIALFLNDSQVIAYKCKDGLAREILKSASGDTYITASGNSIALRNSSANAVLMQLRDDGKIRMDPSTWLQLGWKAPSAPGAGEMYYDQPNERFRLFDSVGWIELARTRTGTGKPAIVPRAFGQDYYDSSNNKWYKAKGTSSVNDWVLLGG